MWLANLWNRWTRNRRMSFYESQHAMRRTTGTAEPIDIRWLNDEALNRIIEMEPGSIRAEAAHYCLEQRARERRASSTGNGILPLPN